MGRSSDEQRRDAAEPALEDIRRDLKGVSGRLDRLLGYIEEHLFDPDLTIGGALQALDIVDSAISTEMTHTVGYPPRDYVGRHRVATAQRLLAETDVPVSQVWPLVGFGNYRSFLRIYRLWAGESPIDTRRRLRRNDGLDLDDPQSWRRAERGELEAEEVVEFRDQFAQRYPDVLDESAAPLSDAEPPLIVDGAVFERFQAEHVVWPALRDRPFEQQLAIVQRSRFTTPALFDLLRDKSRDEGRRQRSRRLELARLALASLDASAEALGPRIRELRALGWAWMGNAQRLEYDFLAAEGSFRKALAQLRGDRDSLAAGDVYERHATLRTFQRRYQEALDLLDRSREIFERFGDSQRQILVLMDRSMAEVFAGRPHDAVESLETAITLADGDERTTFQLNVSMAFALTQTDRYREAAEILKDLRPQLHLVETPLWLCARGVNQAEDGPTSGRAARIWAVVGDDTA